MTDTLQNLRGCGPDPIVAHPGNYDYAPVAIADSPTGPVRLYWAGSHAPAPGDHLFRADAPSVSGPFSEPRLQLAPFAGGADSVHVCDPSVIQATSGRWAGFWFMFYSGSKETGQNPDTTGLTGIHVAWSHTGDVPWHRTYAYQPIIAPRGATFPGSYGAGQPSVFYRDEDQYFYLLYTDTTGLTATANGTGRIVYLLRSNNFYFNGRDDDGPYDPPSHLQEYHSSSNTWQDLGSTRDPQRTMEAYVLDAAKHYATVDWAYAPLGDWSESRVIIASNDYNVGGTFSDVYHRPFANLTQTTQQHTIAFNVNDEWLGKGARTLDGPGFVRQRNGTIAHEWIREGRPCVTVDLVTSIWHPSPWDPEKGFADPNAFLTSEIFWSGADVWTQ
jgi:hypothetical protein